jgi:MFS family permease
MYPTAIRSTGIGWAMGMGRVGPIFGPALIGGLVGGLGGTVVGIFYATAVPCVIGAVFLVLLKATKPASGTPT